MHAAGIRYELAGQGIWGAVMLVPADQRADAIRIIRKHGGLDFGTLRL